MNQTKLIQFTTVVKNILIEIKVFDILSKSFQLYQPRNFR